MFWPRKTLALLTILMGASALYDVPSSFEKTGTLGYLLVFALTFIVGGTLMLVPIPHSELAGLILHNTALSVWIISLLFVETASWTGVIFGLTLLVFFLTRTAYLYKQIRGRR